MGYKFAGPCLVFTFVSLFVCVCVFFLNMINQCCQGVGWMDGWNEVGCIACVRFPHTTTPHPQTPQPQQHTHTLPPTHPPTHPSTGRGPGEVTVEVNGKARTFKVLTTIAFTSTRKRMSVIVKTPAGKYLLLTKVIINNNDNNNRKWWWCRLVVYVLLCGAGVTIVAVNGGVLGWLPCVG
jgi:hypothetical protein